MEQRLAKAEDWAQRPKPQADAPKATDLEVHADIIGRLQLLLKIVPLDLQTDSTRLIIILLQGRGDVPPVPGVTIDHHNLHRSQYPEKIRQLELIEKAEMSAVGKLLGALKQKTEGGVPMLDHTNVLFGSNLGNANSHDWRNLPIPLAGGGFKHGQHLAFDAKNNVPLCNLFVQVRRQKGDRSRPVRYEQHDKRAWVGLATITTAASEQAREAAVGSGGREANSTPQLRRIAACATT